MAGDRGILEGQQLGALDAADNDGVPIAIKDVISTRGVETTAGSKILKGYVPVFDATVTERCRAERPLLREVASRQVACHYAENFLTA